MSNNTKFIETLTFTRIISGLKSYEMAEKLGISRSSYTSLEKGINRPTYDILQSLIKEFDVDANMLFEQKKHTLTINRIELEKLKTNLTAALKITERLSK